MATLKQRLHRKNSSGGYDTIHMETSSDLVKRPDGSTVEQSLINTSSHISNNNIHVTSEEKNALSNIPSVTNLYTKTETLADDTKILYGLDTAVVPDKVFRNIITRFDLLKTGKSWISVNVKDTNGDPVTQVKVAGIVDSSGGSVYTDATGLAEGYSSSGTITLSITEYADIVDVSKSITVGSGEIVYTEIVATRRNFLKLTSSKNVKFSSAVEKVDITVVGGGGGGGGAYTWDYKGSGGGGGYCVVKDNIMISPETIYQAVVGSGGSAGSSKTAGGKGGSSSFLNIVANGGSGGSGATNDIKSIYVGTGNGNGGLASNDGNLNSGHDGTVYGYSSYTETVLYGGGGGGGGRVSYSVQNGGRDFGGGGGGGQGIDGGGGGGGGASGTESGHIYYGGRGGSGCVAMRIHFKEAA